MTLILPPDSDAPSNPAIILAFVRDNIGHADIRGVCHVEDSLHDRLRILRERERPADLIRAALVLCAERRAELTRPAGQAGTAASPCFVDLKDV